MVGSVMGPLFSVEFLWGALIGEVSGVLGWTAGETCGILPEGVSTGTGTVNHSTTKATIQNKFSAQKFP